MAESLAAHQVPLIADFTTSTPNPDFEGVRIGVITFPGTLDNQDAARAIRLAGGTTTELWHDEDNLHNVDAVIIPGGFSYGDYLRAGAIAAKAPVMRPVIAAANAAGTSGSTPLPVLGICNGFQILTEAHLLPGCMIKNDHRKFICRDQRLRIDNNTTAWTTQYTAGQEIVVPLKNQDGQYVADQKTLDELEAEGRVVFRYTGFNPNGSRNEIAGISNKNGNVVGLMPHPEHAIEPGFGPSSSGRGAVPLRAGADGLGVFTSVLTNLIHAR